MSAPVSIQTEGFVSLTGVNFAGGEGASGSTMSWTNATAIPGSNSNLDVTDVDHDGKLDAGTDYFADPTATFTGYTVTLSGDDYPVFAQSGGYFLPLSQDGTTQSLIPNAPGASNVWQSEVTAYPLCFAVGTGIATATGEVRVEDLAIGDLIATATGLATRVLWIGRQTVHKLRSGPRLQPVRIRAGALGAGLPHADLTVSADHGMILDDMVVNASALVNGHSIDFVPMADLPASFTLYHVETENHEVILANGAPSETFLDATGRAAFDNHGEYLDLYGAERIIPEMPRTRISAQRLLPDHIRARLGIEAEAEVWDFPKRASA